MSRDLALHFAHKLSNEWSASSVTGQLSEPVISYISSSEKWKALDSQVRTRLVLSPLFLRLKELHDLQPALSTLKTAANDDKDDWVRCIAAAVGPYDGRLHMDEVINSNSMVKSTLDEICRHGVDADADLYRPLEEKYLSKQIVQTLCSIQQGSAVTRKLTAHNNGDGSGSIILSHSHFVAREPPSSTTASPSQQNAAAATSAAATIKTTTTTAKAPVLLSSSSVAAARTTSKITAIDRSTAFQSKPPLPPSQLKTNKPIMSSTIPSTKTTTIAPTAVGTTKSSSVGGGMRKLGSSNTSGGSGRFSVANKFLGSKKKAPILDIKDVTQLNQQAAAEKEKRQKEEEEEKERTKAEAKAAKIAEKEAIKKARISEMEAKRAEMKQAKELAKKAGLSLGSGGGGRKKKVQSDGDGDGDEGVEKKKKVVKKRSVVDDGDNSNGGDGDDTKTKNNADTNNNDNNNNNDDTTTTTKNNITTTTTTANTVSRPAKIQKTNNNQPTASPQLLDPSIAVQALEQASMLADVQAMVDDDTDNPVYLQYVQFAQEDSDDDELI